MKAGFARVDITPPLGAPVDGYFRDRSAKGVLDPLELNAIALSDGENTVVMIAADMLGINTAEIPVIKKLIFDRLGLKEDQIVLSALHQHTSFMFKHKVAGNLPKGYADVLYAKFGDVAQMAIDDMKDAEISTAEGLTEEPIGFVRRYFLNDGRVATNPGSKLLPLVVGRCAESDNTVRFIRFKREEAKDIALVNFSTHPDVISGELLSADWPGFTRRFVESDNPDVSCIFFTGAEGDSNHLDFLGEMRRGYEHSRHMGRVVANVVREMWDKTTPHESSKLYSGLTSIFNRSNTSGEEKYEECKAFNKARLEGTLGYNPTIEECAFARRVINIRENMTLYRELPIAVIGIGDIVIVGLAGEPFADYGRSMREAAKGRFAMTFCLTNGYQGYLPTAKAFEEGGYEAANSHFTPTLQEETVNAATKLIDQI